VQRPRARTRGAETEKFIDREIFEWMCGICGKPIDRTLKHPSRQRVSLDHTVPVSKGGSHTRSNVQAAHLSCNQAKAARESVESESPLTG
jgi:5-methylcytosine-specific restriction endonuclease McrA